MLRLAYRSPAAFVSAAGLQARRRTPLTLARYTTSHHATRLTLPSSESNSKDGSSSSGSNDGGGDERREAVVPKEAKYVNIIQPARFMQSNTICRRTVTLKFLSLGLALAAFSADVLYHLWLDNRRERTLCAAFESATIPDPPYFVDRPEITEKVRKTIASSSRAYKVIVGNHGTGKSTLVKKVASETAGTIYVYVPECGNQDVKIGLTRGLRDALGGERPTFLVKAFWQKLIDKGE
jgi:hypothetical protein